MKRETEELRKNVDRLNVRLGVLELTLVPLLIAEISRPRAGEQLQDRLVDLQGMRHRSHRALKEWGETTSPELTKLVAIEIDKLYDYLVLEIDEASFETNE